MKASRELDALVAEKVMGCKVERFTNGAGRFDAWCRCGNNQHNIDDGPGCGFLLDYSDSIADAWLVVEKMRSTHCCLTLKSDYDYVWECYCIKDPDGQDHNKECIRDYKVYAMAETAPLAICLAALKAVEVEIPQ